MIDIEQLYLQAPCGYITFLQDGTIVKINQTLLAWLGYEEDDLIYIKKFTDLLVKGGQIHYSMFMLPILVMNGVVREMSYDLTRKDGTLLPVLITGNTIKDDAGKVKAINLAILDITERRDFEQSLILAKKQAEAEKTKFEFLAGRIPEMVWTADDKGHIDYLNRFALDYFGMDKKRADIVWLISKIHPLERKDLIRGWAKSLRTGQDFLIRIRLEKNAGQYEWHELKAIPDVDKDGKAQRWFGTCTNIDVHVMAMQRKDEFIAVASHELQNPITGLKGYLQLMEMTDDVSLNKSLASKALRTLTNLHFLVSSLLDVSIINSGELELGKSVFSLNEVVAMCVDQLLHNHGTHRIDFEQAQPAFMVSADRERISQVVTNLINNAIKYSPGKGRVIARLLPDDTGQNVVFEIQDFGIGIAYTQQALIFQKYFRVEDGRPSAIKGLGLGLYIIQNILSKHNATIHVKSEVGVGSTFSFALPLHI